MNIRFSGFGGQGIVLSGFILGNAAIKDGNNAIQTQSYGSESRGGACRSDVIISDKNINELSPPAIDVLVSMSHSAFEKYIPMLKKGGTLIIDSDLVFPEDVKKFKFYGIPATDIAYKKFGRKIIGNMVMIGYVTAITKIVTKKGVKESIKNNVPKGTENLNIKAFEEGYKLGLKEGRK
ncbi:MAG: 2-oxoacid:acceptor oxidoreductase family protein [Thermoplasmata archaeon]|nr:MAG: 2-oxoacid:acceptor oxidoreductase family protein [Thermoplasmata archaeon]